MKSPYEADRIEGVSIRLRFGVLAALAVGVIGIASCAFVGPGVTTGGQQDVAAFRQALFDGSLPDPESITVEGFLSEHSIEHAAPSNDDLLYITTSAAWHQNFDTFTPLATLLIGFGTNLDLETFERRPQHLCLVIDRSGSMQEPIDHRTSISKLETIRVAVDRLLAQLTPADRVSVVLFNSRARVALTEAAGDDIAAIKGSLDGVSPSGNTDLARALTAGFRLLRERASEDRDSRLFLFTDGLPTVGAMRGSELISVMERYADDPIGATIFGVGVNFGHELISEISQVRGGNFFYLNDFDRVIQVFDEEFEFLVTPLAYDVKLTATIPFTLDVDGVYGLPGLEANGRVLDLTVPTLFLSSRKGGAEIVVRLRVGALADFSGDIELATIDYEYETPDGSVHASRIVEHLPGGLDPLAGESYFESDAVRRAVLLTDTALALRHSAEDSYWGYPYYGGNRLRAIQRLDDLLPYFDELAEGLVDQPSPSSRSLSQERALIETFLNVLRR
jgi:Ca-activated chloride channel homolog